MNKEQRQRELISQMKQVHQSIGFDALAHEYECKPRTIRRDFEHLINEKNAPWYILNNRTYLDPTKTDSIELHGQWFERQELEALFVLNQVIEQLSPGALKNQLKPLENKIHQLLKSQTHHFNLGQLIKLIEIADRYVENTIFEHITQALSQQKQLKIKFWNRQTDVYKSRVISPQQLVRYKDNWKVDAWCHQKNALRTFSLEAIAEIELLYKPSKLIAKKDIKQHFESSYGIFAGKADKQAVIQFSPYIARWVQFEQWHPEQIGQWDIQGNYQLQIPYYHDEELLQDIIKYADQAQILAPPELREKAKQKLKQALKNYSDTI